MRTLVTAGREPSSRWWPPAPSFLQPTWWSGTELSDLVRSDLASLGTFTRIEGPGSPERRDFNSSERVSWEAEIKEAIAEERVVGLS